MEVLQHIALAAGLAWASGIRLYAVVFLAGLLGRLGYLELPAHLLVLEQPVVLYVAGSMFAAEFIADKVPVFDSLWDGLHTLIRIPAGAILAAAALGDMDPVWVMLAALAGGTITAAAHLTKAGGRALINTSPEPLSNWTASLAEDLMVPMGLWLAIWYPVLFLALLLSFVVVAIWLLPTLWRGLKGIFGRIAGGLT